MLNDLRYGVRMLLKRPAVTFVAVLSLALGIGANTAIFSLIDAVMLKSLPIHEPERLVLFGNGEDAGVTLHKTAHSQADAFLRQSAHRKKPVLELLELFGEVALFVGGVRHGYPNRPVT